MGTEIERKFLVKGAPWRNVSGVRFSQGYLNRDKERTVRVRIAGDKAFLTVKGVTRGATRVEFEYDVFSIQPEWLEIVSLAEKPVNEELSTRPMYQLAVAEVLRR